MAALTGQLACPTSSDQSRGSAHGGGRQCQGREWPRWFVEVELLAWYDPEKQNWSLELGCHSIYYFDEVSRVGPKLPGRLNQNRIIAGLNLGNIRDVPLGSIN